MDPHKEFCLNPDCKARGLIGQGNIGVHSRKEGRYICHICGKTFAATKGTPFYRRHYKAEFISQMVSLLAHGCPPQAIIATYGIDERTVADWQQAAGTHCRQVHEAVVQQGRLDLQQVQTDEIRVKAQGQIVWMALAIAVTTRLKSQVETPKSEVDSRDLGLGTWDLAGQGLRSVSATFGLF